MKKQINEIKRMQQLAGLLKEESIPGGPDEVSLKVFLDVLGLNSNDPIFKHAYQNHDIEELLQMIEDTAGLDQYTKSDLINAMEQAQFSQDMIDQIIDENPLVKGLERGMVNENQEIDLFDIIDSNKNELAKKFYLDIESSMVSGNAEDEPVQILDDNGDQVDFVKKIDWESNKGFYNNNQGIGEIKLNGVDIIYIINPL
jgi:hypothetical protein